MASNTPSSPPASPSIAPRRPSARASPPLLALPPPAASAASSSVAPGASSPRRSSVSPPPHHKQQGQVPASLTQRLGVRSSLATVKPQIPRLPPPLLALPTSTTVTPAPAVTSPGGTSSNSTTIATTTTTKAPTSPAASPTPYNSPRSPPASTRRASWAPNLIAAAGATPLRSGAAGAAAPSPRSPQNSTAEDGPSPTSPTASTATKDAAPFPFPAPPPSPPTPTRPLRVTSLPRGGSYVMTCIGPVQLGIPPETIKDALNAGLPVPRHFIVPSQRFNRQLGAAVGINVAEFEFPAYYNFFFKRQPVNLVVEPEVEARIRTVFHETLFGPRAIDYEADFAPELAPESRPDLLKELRYFRKFGDTFLEIDMLLRFTHFNAQGVATIEEATPEGKKVAVQIITSATNGGEYVIREVYEQAEQPQPSSSTDDDNTSSSNSSGGGDGPVLPGVASLSGIILLRNHQMYAASASLSVSSIGGGGGGESRFFTPPLFGVTVLGSSHGFDPKGSTSGYVLWINRRGIMVDPPPHSTTILEKNQIHPSAIDGIIVTHVHGDHDAGAFQKILCERRVTVITSPTVYDAFIRKYAALSGIDADFLRRSHRFRPVRVGQELKLRGASFRFFYSLHSIPCLGFEVFFGGKSIVLSGDHMNDPARIQAMFEEGVLSEGRRDELLAFPWHHDLILHEAGIPPIHTPLATLEALPEDVKRRVHVVHVSEGAVREGSGLRAAKPGVRNTLELEVDVPEFSAAVSTLNLVNDIHFLSGLSLAHARGLLEIAFTRRFNAGQTVVARGARGGDEFCVILTGLLEVSYALPEEDDEEEDEEPPEAPASPTALGGEASSPPPAPAPRRKAVRWTMGDWFGEEVLMAPSSASSSAASSLHRQREVRALTDVELLVFPGAELRYILQDTDIAARLQRRLLGGAGQLQLEELLARNFTLRSLTRAQKLHLEGIAQARQVARGEYVWRAGDPAGCCVLVQEGTLAYGGQAGRLMRSVGALLYARRRKSGSLGTSVSGSPSSNAPAAPTLLSQGEDATQTPCPYAFEKGNLVGNPSLLLREGAAQPFDLVAVTDAALVVFPAEGMVDFFTQNPGVLLCLLDAELVL